MNGNKKRIGCGGVIGIFLLVCVAVALFSKGGSSTKNSTSSTPKPTKEVTETLAPKATGEAKASETPKPTSTPKPTNTPQPTEAPKPVLSLGETATIGELEFTVKSMSFSIYAGGLSGLNASDSDYRYCVVYVDVNNPTNDTVKLVHSVLGLSGYTDYNVDLIFDGEVKYNHSFAKYTDFLFGNEEILPRAILTNKALSFKVPISVSTSTDSLQLIISNNGKDETIWKLR